MAPGPVLSWLLVLGIGAALVLLARPARGVEEESLPRGPQLYQANCASCHGIQGTGTFRGPTLVGVGAASADYWLRSGMMPLSEPDAEPVRSEPAFSEEEILLLVDYVAQLGDGPPIPDVDLGSVDLARGGELYRINCAACHNWDGKGGALVNSENAPRLHPVPVRQVADAVRAGPGAMPQFTDEQLDEEALSDVVAYVDYLRSPRDEGGFGLAHWGPSTETVAGFFGLGVLVLVTAWLGERRRD
jgi:ubiquinol-cytochrome c reductase cytochrome c subunit